MKFPSLTPKSSLGIDIGSYSIKIVELSSFAGNINLENYVIISSKVLKEKPFRVFEKNTLSLSAREINQLLKEIFKKHKLKAKQAFFSIPDFASFFVNFELPPLRKEEISFTIEREARRYIPVPLSEVIWDWQILGSKSIDKKEKLKILLVAIPLEVFNQYQLITEGLGLKSFSLEAEVFSLARALIENKEGVVSLVDVGARTTTCSIIDNGILKLSHSFDLSGDDFTEAIAKSLQLDFDFGEKLKIRYGLSDEMVPEGKNIIREILIPLVDLIFKESYRVMEKFHLSEGKEIDKIILAGGGVKIPGLLEHFKNQFKKEVEFANPFKNIKYSPPLEEILREKGPILAIAVGLAKRGLK